MKNMEINKKRWLNFKCQFPQFWISFARLFTLYRDQSYEHASELEKAIGRHFEPKVRFAVLTDKINKEVGDSINIFHSFRNDIYHVGLQHEAILPQLANFYFKIASDFLVCSRPIGWVGIPAKNFPNERKNVFRAPSFVQAPSKNIKLDA